MQKQKGVSTLVGIAIITVAIVVLFGGVFAYQYFSKPQTPTPNVQPNPKPQTNSNVQNQNAETAGWKTYKNDKYGFEVKYPPYLNISDENDSFADLFNADKTMWVSIGVARGMRPDYTSFDELSRQIKNEIGKDYSNGGTIRVLDSNIDIKNETMTWETIGAPSHVPSINTAIKYGSEFISLNTYSKKELDISKLQKQNYTELAQLEKIHNSIISTFKFTK